MSLLDDVSIVVTPNGYKAGELYAVVPSDGAADMDVTRATDATRVDEDGLIADVLANVPRIDYSGGGCPHILAEPQRTNLLPYSEDFSQGAWVKTRCVIDSGGHTSPSGESNAFKMTATDDDARLQDGSEAAGIVYTQSIYVKSATGSDVSGQIDFTGVDIQTFTATSEWQRVDTTLTNMAKSGLVRVRITNSGDELYVWGAQVEQGSYATSYIPTSGSTVTRNQDQFTRDGIGSLINSTEGVLFLEVAALSDDGTNRYFSVSDGTTSNYIYFRFVSTSNTVLIRTAVEGNTINTLQKEIADTTAFNKYAFKWKSGDYAFWINGIEVLTDSSSTVFGSNVLNQIEFSFPSLGGGGSNSKVKQLQVYKTALGGSPYDATLSDARLEALTSL